MGEDNGDRSTEGEKRLEQISAKLNRGETVEPITVSELLRWFGATRRGVYINGEIRRSLRANDLWIEPDLSVTSLDGQIEFREGLNPGSATAALFAEWTSSWSEEQFLAFEEGKLNVDPNIIPLGKPLTKLQADAVREMWVELLQDRGAAWADRNPGATAEEKRNKFSELANLDLNDLAKDESAEIIQFPSSDGFAQGYYVPIIGEIINPTIRLGDLEISTVRLAPNDSLAKAISVMCTKNLSHAPVFNGRTLRGVISWRTIALRLASGADANSTQVGERSDDEEPHVEGAGTPLLDAMANVERHQYVLVRDQSEGITGILTLRDLLATLRQHATCFLQLKEIEVHIRNFLVRAGVALQRRESNPRKAKASAIQATNLTFNDYIDFLSDDGIWSKARIRMADKKQLLSDLKEALEIRNRTMHFRDSRTGDNKKLEDIVAELRLASRFSVDR